MRNKQAGRGGDRTHRTLGGKSKFQGKTSSDRQRYQRKENIKAYVSEIDVSVNWIHMVQNMTS